jgi:FixJ family two-component response regulator
MELISVVDDDESVRSATIDLLNSVGFDCEAFESAEAYLRSERVGRASCLILDITMPGLSGLELQRQLVHSGYSIPIIFITAFPEQRTLAQAMQAGAICYLPKPYSDGTLIDCVRRALNDRQHGISEAGSDD